ncbi:hypothetical protein [Bifidobacterium sp. ESL0790]|uniref:hypothetical protein n=1 Tax=Bifidobacterium sp. ESL0790 TaxID=2983233 RepID=UPI0023F8C563|nr:hypothetical protein [Bifidobacterium sp. ESL0790]WEV72076.1 hypothetical protein OZY47_06445 [Bifidobacterium sp. ESL0790]
MAACTAPTIQTTPTQAGPCETAYTAASQAQAHAAPGNPLPVRYFSAGNASLGWSEAAAQCPSQFDMDTMRAAQARWTQATMAPLFGFAAPGADAETMNLDNVVALNIDDEALNGVALAEDRAGFEVQVLTARGSDGASLLLSDNHHSVASRLISLRQGLGETNGANKTSGSDGSSGTAGAGGTADASGGNVSADPRQKVYDVTNLINNPQIIDDPSTGLRAPTMAVVEMNCARESVDAVAKTHPSASTKRNATDKSLAALSDLAASRAYYALTLGYPAFDEALFK